MSFKLKIIAGMLIPGVLSGFFVVSFINKEIPNGLVSNGYSGPTAVWWGGNFQEGNSHVAVDSSGNIYMTCFSRSFGVVGRQIFLVKYDSSLNMLWNVSWITNNDSEPCGIAIDSNEDIIIAGTMFAVIATATFDVDIFVLKFDSTGTLVWDTVQHIAKQEESAFCMTLDNSDNIYVAGVTNSSSGSLFIEKFDSGGNFQQISFYGTTAPRELAIPGGIEVDGSGNIFIGGTTDNSGGNIYDILLAKLDSSGNHLWNTTWGGPAPWDYGTDIVLSGSDIYIVGETESLATAPIDAILIKYDSSGNVVWNATWNLINDFGKALVINPSGNIVIAGETDPYYGALIDKFVAEYNPSGVLLWNTTWDGGAADNTHDMAICDTTGSIFVVGSSYNTTNGSYDISLTAYFEIATTTGTPTTTSPPPTTPTNTSSPPPTTTTSPTNTTGSPTFAPTGFIPGFLVGTSIFAIGTAAIIVRIVSKKRKD